VESPAIFVSDKRAPTLRGGGGHGKKRSLRRRHGWTAIGRIAILSAS
jgi:hypothetical protein